MGGAADERVGGVGQRVEHVVAHQRHARTHHERLQQVRRHLAVHRACNGKRSREEYVQPASTMGRHHMKNTVHCVPFGKAARQHTAPKTLSDAL